MRRVLLLLLLTGCAKSVPTPDAAPQAAPRETQARPTAIFQDATRPTIYKDPAMAATTTFAKPPNVVAAAVRLTYDKLEVPITLDDAAPMRIGNADFYRARNFAGKRMTVLVKCGDSITGPNAATFRIYMSLITTITPDGRGGSIVDVLLTANARDIAGGSSNDRVPCGSTGALEQQMFDALRGYLAAGDL